MYKPLPNSLTIKNSTIDGLGIFATELIPAQTHLGIIHIEIYNEIIRTPLGGFYNHSDTPNCKKIYSDSSMNGIYPIPIKKTILVALRDIEKGEELTAKYTLYQVDK